MNTGQNEHPANRSVYLLPWTILLLAFVAYLLRCHFVKAYSDPTGWISMAETLMYEGEVSKWSTVFAMYLTVPLKILGLQYVFLSNVLWIVTLVLLLGAGGVVMRRRQAA